MPPDLDLERLRGHRLFVGTPMVAGQCHSDYAFSIAQLSALCVQLGIALRFFFACDEALVTKARNLTVDEFLRSGDANLMFIDADVGFDARDVIRLLALQEFGDGAAYDVVAAPYPLKRIAWEGVREAVRQGFAEADAAALEGFASPVLVSPAHEAAFPINRPVEVAQAATGFMMIRRQTFEAWRRAYPHRRYKPDRIGMDAQASSEIHAFFDTEIDSREANLREEIDAFLASRPQASAAELRAFLASDAPGAREYGGRLVSEDHAFCRRARAAGLKVWLCPWMELRHTGNHTFAGRLADLAALAGA